MPHQVKIFIGSLSEEGSEVQQLEEDINHWLSGNSTLSVVGRETRICRLGGKEGAARVLIVVTIWCHE